jgi:hypothetical protein
VVRRSHPYLSDDPALPVGGGGRRLVRGVERAARRDCAVAGEWALAQAWYGDRMAPAFRGHTAG